MEGLTYEEVLAQCQRIERVRRSWEVDIVSDLVHSPLYGLTVRASNGQQHGPLWTIEDVDALLMRA